MGKITFEIAAESVNSIKSIQKYGFADRIELCDNLLVGGTTPSAGMIRLSRKILTMPMMVLIRPRPGDFNYTDAEFEVMLSDIAFAKQTGCDGIVTGMLRPDGQVDRERMARVVDAAQPIGITFHRAFDMARDPFEALEVIIELGIGRVLTSGQKASSWDGRVCIHQLVDCAKGRISVMAGGGLNDENVRKLVAETGVTEVHASARGKVESTMIFRRDEMSMARPVDLNEYQWLETNLSDASRIRQQLEMMG